MQSSARKGRPPKNASRHSLSAVTAHVPLQKPTMKYREAAHLADKNSRTMAKITQLLNVIQQPGFNPENPQHKLVEKYIEKLNKRVSRRLAKLAKWSDSSLEDRLSEFRHIRPILIGNARQLPFSKPLVMTYNAPVPVASHYARPPMPAAATANVAAIPNHSMHHSGHHSNNPVRALLATMPAIAPTAAATATTGAVPANIADPKSHIPSLNLTPVASAPTPAASAPATAATDASSAGPIEATTETEKEQVTSVEVEKTSEAVEESKGEEPMDEGEEEEEVEAKVEEEGDNEDGEGGEEGEEEGEEGEEIEVDDDGLEELVDEEQE